jgi:hypothetical protein
MTAIRTTSIRSPALIHGATPLQRARARHETLALRNLGACAWRRPAEWHCSIFVVWTCGKERPGAVALRVFACAAML